MSLTLGEKLRQAREERGISISEVAEQTRISPLYLESIEKDEYKILPGGIFNKGFVKSYAKYVGVDENEALQDYAKMMSVAETADPIDEYRSYRPEVLTDDRSSSSMLPTIIFAGIILALMTGGILFVVNYIQNQQAEPQANISAPPTNSNAAASSVAANTAPAPPATGSLIDVELKAVSEPVWVSYSVDGTAQEKTLAADESLKAQANDSFRISYSKSRLRNLEIFLNGRKIEAPDPGSKSKVELEINKQNISQYLKAEETSASQPVARPQQTPTHQSFRTPQPAANATANRIESPSPATTAKPAPTSPRPRTPSPKPIGTPIVIRPTPESSPR